LLSFIHLLARLAGFTIASLIADHGGSVGIYVSSPSPNAILLRTATTPPRFRWIFAQPPDKERSIKAWSRP
jgi:hypothetical protein